jgi:hypothetical protein
MWGRTCSEVSAVVLIYRFRHFGSTEWRIVRQRVPITWTECHLGGRRPWFKCAVYSNGRYCGRRVAKIYHAGDVFACRHCLGLAYATQQEPVRERGILTARKIDQASLSLPMVEAEKAAGVLAEQCDERFLEVTGGNARKEDHCGIIDCYISRVENGKLEVKKRIPKEELASNMPFRHNLSTMRV